VLQVAQTTLVRRGALHHAGYQPAGRALRPPRTAFLDVAATWDGVLEDMADVKELVRGGGLSARRARTWGHRGSFMNNGSWRTLNSYPSRAYDSES